MTLGIIKYDDEGRPVCQICGKSFQRILPHVRQKHFLSEREYKIKLGLDLNKGICSKESAERTRIKTLENFDKVVTGNLLKGGQKSRFKKGSEGRRKNKVSEQTKIMLANHAKSNITTEKRQELGKILGKSGLGNKTKYKNNGE
jgi:hypothetical protein